VVVVTPAERVRAALEAAGSRRQGRDWQCPAHDDRQASLSVAEGRDGRVVLHCHAGCRTEDVIATLGLGWADLFPEGRKG
jgi:putative DNA primase/helicase